MIITWTNWMEKRISFSELLINLYKKYYKKIVDYEIEIADIKDNDKVLCIGGGPIPCTALRIAKMTRSEIHIIDMDDEAVQRAKRVIEKAGLKDRIFVKTGNGEEIDPENFDVIHIALQVKPKELVLENILNKSKKGTRIVVRMPKERKKFFYSNISNKFLTLRKDCIKNYNLNCYNPNIEEVLLVIKN